MKQLACKLQSWWFATMTPAHVPLNTIDARETMRKRRLLSGVLLIPLSIMSLFYVLQIITRATGVGNVQTFLGAGFLLLSLWINRQGYLKCASLFYLLTSFIEMITVVITLSRTVPIFTFSFLPMLLVLPVVAGLFLPPWGPLLFAVIEDAFFYWFMRYERQSLISFYMKSPANQLMLLIFTCLFTIVIAGFSAISAQATNKAIIQADRAVELEQAHQELALAHTNLKTVHSTLEMTHAKLEGAYVTIHEQALTDGLTGLLNHRAVVDQLEKELESVRRSQRPFSLLFFDADRFKSINDTYGHAAGDAVLCQISERAGSVLRGGDTLGRFGGEEFVALLPEADGDEASRIAERLRLTIANKPVALVAGADDLTITVSVGVATYQIAGYKEQNLLQQADRAMYLAKHLGRNQVRTALEAENMNAILN